MGSFRVRVSKDYTVFAAGHFVTYEGDQCEPLHGHNYRAAISLEGELDENSYVYNFVPLKKLFRAVCDRLDHRMLLPTDNSLLDIRLEGGGYVVRYGDKTYVFPQADVVQLPIPNTTVERLAEWICGQMEIELGALGGHRLSAIEVEVAETFGQSAFFRKDLA